MTDSTEERNSYRAARDRTAGRTWLDLTLLHTVKHFSCHFSGEDGTFTLGTFTVVTSYIIIGIMKLWYSRSQQTFFDHVCLSFGKNCIVQTESHNEARE